MMKEAYYYDKIENNYVVCRLCPNMCKIAPEDIGRCGVRKNVEGMLCSLNYGRITACALDPIEKKPLRHFYPGSKILSIGTYGCNFKCEFCQNWHIAQMHPFVEKVSIDEMFEIIDKQEDNIGVAYTYNEPTIFYEYMLDLAKKVHYAGYKNVVVSNGYINEAPLKELLPFIDAFNIDLKAFNDEFYKTICKGERLPVMKTIERIYGHAHMELTVLLIDGKNTNLNELEEMFKWIAEIGSDIPVHLSRYHPAYKMDDPVTALDTLLAAREIANDYLDHVYLGNVPVNTESS